jgi:hypothetical protein
MRLMDTQARVRTPAASSSRCVALRAPKEALRQYSDKAVRAAFDAFSRTHKPNAGEHALTVTDLSRQLSIFQ